MKTSKSPENTDITPSKRKLKQARLPFMLITEVSAKADPPQPRKRKLSVPDVPVPKVGKICKENDLAKELVVISDDESKDAPSQEKDLHTPHPFVKLVDNARKKKLQKAKIQKKGKKKTKKWQNRSVDTTTESNPSECEDVEMTNVQDTINEDNNGKSTPCIDNLVSSDNTVNSSITKVITEPDSKSTKTNVKTSETVICLDDSDESCDTVMINTSGKPLFLNTEKEISEKSSATKTTKKTSSEIVNNTTPKRTPRNKKSSPCKTPKSNSKTDNPDQKSTSNEPIPEKSSDIVKILSSEGEKNDTTVIENSKPNSKGQKENLEKENNITPKRSGRNKTKVEEKSDLKASSVSSKLNDSICSSPATPKQNKSLVVDESLNNTTPLPANLTPKQLQKRLESAKKREEREKEKLERETKRQQEKEERAKQRQEKEDLKKKEREEKEDAKRREREEKEEQRKKEKEEKEKQKELEKKLREQKEEEKRKERENKEEQKRREKESREEEKRKRQEALELEKQEQDLKKKKAAEAFVNFFVPKQKTYKEQGVVPSKNDILSSFSVKVDMRLAPTIRADLSEDNREVLDKLMEEQKLSKTQLYLNCLKDGKVKPQSSGKTWPNEDKDDEDDVMIIEDELPPIDSTGEILQCAPEGAPREKLRPKMLSFHENRRPPYWGTWRKISPHVKPRRPFAQDEKLLDYEVDSDDDWEEEAEGESLDGSVCGSDEDGERDDYEVDNEVFVPHGYLSDEEATMDEEDDVLSLTPETQKARLKHLEAEFETEMKKPTEKLKPRMYGLLWEDASGGKPENCVDALWNYFSKFSMIMDDPTPFLQPSKEADETEKKKIKKKKVPEEGKESPKVEKKKKVKEQKEGKKSEPKKVVPNQPGINSFLFAKLKSS